MYISAHYINVKYLLVLHIFYRIDFGPPFRSGWPRILVIRTLSYTVSQSWRVALPWQNILWRQTLCRLVNYAAFESITIKFTGAIMKSSAKSCDCFSFSRLHRRIIVNWSYDFSSNRRYNKHVYIFHWVVFMSDILQPFPVRVEDRRPQWDL